MGLPVASAIHIASEAFHCTKKAAMPLCGSIGGIAQSGVARLFAEHGQKIGRNFRSVSVQSIKTRTEFGFYLPSFFNHMSPSRLLNRYHNLHSQFMQTMRITNAY